MEILAVVQAKRNLAEQVLRDLIANYKALNDTVRLEKSNTIQDEINSYLQIEENLFFSYVRKAGDEAILPPIKAVHDEIEMISEHSIMMHVDEPSGEYYQDMLRLIEAIEKAKRNDDEILFPWAEKNLSEADQYEIATQFKNQMVHESLPSSGMTVY